MSGLARKASRTGRNAHLAGKRVERPGADTKLRCNLGEWSAVDEVLLSDPVRICCDRGPPGSDRDTSFGEQCGDDAFREARERGDDLDRLSFSDVELLE